MKTFLFCSCIFLLLIPFVTSADPTLRDTVNQGQQVVNTLNNPSARDTYLKEQWADFLNQSSFGKGVRESERQLKSLDFAWKFFIGVPFSWSFLFIFSFIIWLSLGTWIKRVLAFFELWDHTLHWIVGFAVATLASAMGVERTIAGWGVGLTQGLNILGINPLIVQLILQLALIMGVIYLGMFTTAWQNIFLRWKESRDRTQEKKDIKQLKEEVEGMKKKDTHSFD